MRTLYSGRDIARGPQKTMLWLVSEVGELAEAMVKENSLEVVRTEVADVLAWLCSLCNVLEIDLEKSATSKYGDKCPRCKSSPCKCAIR
nr:MazG nucleotide pyrophosphohydrolase domain-containing protein [Candidatus Njordarchaeota archaeon]